MKPKTITVLIFALVGIAVFWIHLAYLHTGVDYHYTFRPAVQGWLHGQAIYTPPFYGFFNAPWLVLFLTPLEWLTDNGAEAGLMLLTVAGLVGLWRAYSRGYRGYALPISLAIIIANLHTFDLIFRGQIDVFVGISVLCMYEGHKRDNPYWVGVGWVLSAVRPTSIGLLLIYSAWLAYQHKYLLRALIVPVLTFLASLVIFGPDWPLRWYTMIHSSAPPQPGPWLVSWGHAAAFLGLSPIIPAAITLIILAVTIYVMFRFQPTLRVSSAFLVAASLCVVPYTLSYHYSVMLATCLPVLLTWRLRLAIPLLVLTLTPLARLFLSLDIAWIDIALPLAIWLMLIGMIWAKAATQSAAAKFTADRSQLAPSN